MESWEEIDVEKVQQRCLQRLWPWKWQWDEGSRKKDQQESFKIENPCFTHFMESWNFNFWLNRLARVHGKWWSDRMWRRCFIVEQWERLGIHFVRGFTLRGFWWQLTVGLGRGGCEDDQRSRWDELRLGRILHPTEWTQCWAPNENKSRNSWRVDLSPLNCGLFLEMLLEQL